MVTTPFCEHTVSESGETTIVIEYGDDGHARLDVWAKRYGRGSAEAGRLACEAIHQARLRSAARIEGALDASSSTCGAILEALHGEIGHDLESIIMRRAGSSVMVTLDTRPAMATSTPTPVHAPSVPTQPDRSHRVTAAGTPVHVRTGRVPATT